MPRSAVEVTDPAILEEILSSSPSCRIGFAAGTTPYIVNLCYGYEWRTGYRQKGVDDGARVLNMYFITRTKGRTIDFLRKNNLVCFELDVVHGHDDSSTTACEWGMKYRSIVGLGLLEDVEDEAERRKAIELFFGHYGEEPRQACDDEAEPKRILRLEVTEYTARQRL